MRWREPELIGGPVRRQLARFGDAGRLGEVVEAWPRAVGDSVARNAWPARIARDGTLHVATSSSAWAFELAQLEDAVRGQLAEQLAEPAPKRLRFAPGPLPEPSAAVEDRRFRVPAEPGPKERARARELTAGIADDELRERVARAAAASLAEAANGRSVW